MKHTLAAACEGSEWIDADTPASACTVAGRGGEQLSLVFSDEFELEGRRFGDGRDSRWTAVETLPYTNKQLNVYNPHLPVICASSSSTPPHAPGDPPLGRRSDQVEVGGGTYTPLSLSGPEPAAADPPSGSLPPPRSRPLASLRS